MDLLSLDPTPLLTFLVEKALKYFGPDKRMVKLRDRLLQRIRLSTEEASYVQCIGMPKPIPVTSIYQPSRFIQEDGEWLDVDLLLRSSQSAIIFAGPGMGKSTLLNHVYLGLAESNCELPLLFPLRSPVALEDLKYVVQNLGRLKAEISEESERLKKEEENELTRDSDRSEKARGRVAELGAQRRKLDGLLGKAAGIRLVLLVDGYDEISENERLSVSDLLNIYSSLALGRYILTCRSFYDVYSLKVNRYFIAPFSREDAERFVAAFMQNYGKQIDAKEFLCDLDSRGFKDFISHPLMLTLVCILKTGRNLSLPRNSISLIRRALEILTFRWDEEKGIHRESEFSLDGEDRLRCIMRVAYRMELDQASDGEIEKIVGEHLTLLQSEDVQPLRLMREIAQWFGIIYQGSDFNWRFLHKVIHDYLAAKFWVESAAFNPTQVRTWNARAGYAACLVPDATQSLVYALRFSKDVAAFVEALSNNPLFKPCQVALVVLEHFRTYREFLYSLTEGELEVNTWQDFFPYASDAFVDAMLEASVDAEGRDAELVTAYAGSEILRRGRSIKQEVARSLALKYERLPSLTFIVKRGMALHRFTLRDLLNSDAISKKPGEAPASE